MAARDAYISFTGWRGYRDIIRCRGVVGAAYRWFTGYRNRHIPQHSGVGSHLWGVHWIFSCSGYFDGQRLKLGCLARVLDSELPPDVSDVECRQRAPIYLLLILGGHLLSDKSGNKVSLLGNIVGVVRVWRLSIGHFVMPRILPNRLLPIH